MGLQCCWVGIGWNGIHDIHGFPPSCSYIYFIVQGYALYVVGFNTYIIECHWVLCECVKDLAAMGGYLMVVTHMMDVQSVDFVKVFLPFRCGIVLGGIRHNNTIV